ncbi:unnamed protein product [Pleuronectes platessa]|uniref:Uncharacterized protein n=1 Tax=Pleuronectes platessa TaxID=8262 RepID=A0A9N7YMD7_PLEPL|nr:unnamed protein product [Pleuronectes platessa]
MAFPSRPRAGRGAPPRRKCARRGPASAGERSREEILPHLHGSPDARVSRAALRQSLSTGSRARLMRGPDGRRHFPSVSLPPPRSVPQGPCVNTGPLFASNVASIILSTLAIGAEDVSSLSHVSMLFYLKQATALLSSSALCYNHLLGSLFTRGYLVIARLLTPLPPGSLRHQDDLPGPTRTAESDVKSPTPHPPHTVTAITYPSSPLSSLPTQRAARVTGHKSPQTWAWGFWRVGALGEGGVMRRMGGGVSPSLCANGLRVWGNFVTREKRRGAASHGIRHPPLSSRSS